MNKFRVGRGYYVHAKCQGGFLYQKPIRVQMRGGTKERCLPPDMEAKDLAGIVEARRSPEGPCRSQVGIPHLKSGRQTEQARDITVIEHWNAECPGWNVCKIGNRYQAAQPVGMAIQKVFGVTSKEVPRSLRSLSAGTCMACCVTRWCYGAAQGRSP